MRVMDVMFAFPFIILAIVIIGVLGPNLTNAMIALGIVYLPRFARIVRGPILAVMQEDYILACRAIGAPHVRTMVRHVLPNVLSPLIVQTTLAVSTAIKVTRAREPIQRAFIRVSVSVCRTSFIVSSSRPSTSSAVRIRTGLSRFEVGVPLKPARFSR